VFKHNAINTSVLINEEEARQSVFSRLDEGKWSASQSGSCTTVEEVSYTNRRGSWRILRSVTLSWWV